jgi:hypothetical protein
MTVRENIRLSKPNFAVCDGFYYSFLYDTGVLLVKTDDGTQAFGYVADQTIDQPIKELCFDGIFFWSLEDYKPGATVTGFVIRKWALHAFICKQISKYTFADTATHTYRADSFAVEHYRSSVGLGNDCGLYGNGYTGVNALKEIYLYDTSKLSVGDNVYFVKRWTPAHNRYGTSNIEQMYVNQIISSTKVEFSSNTVGDPYDDNKGWRGKEATPTTSDPLPPDEVYWTKYLWVFNSGPSPAALYKINAYNGSNISQYSGSQYDDVYAATFYAKYDTDTKTADTRTLTFNTAIDNDSSYGGLQTYALFTKSSSCLFYNVSTNVMDRSMAIDNVKVDTISLWTIYDMDIVGTEPEVVLLRLQNGCTYTSALGVLTDETWSSVYNYDRSLMKRHIKSISIVAEPSIVPITTGTADIYAYCRDQYNDALPTGVTVTWSDDDTGTGSASLQDATSQTDSFGKATNLFLAGTTEKDVKITASAVWPTS